MRKHRIGSITSGGVLILFGILFLLQFALPVISYAFIFRIWPVILIALGVEILYANLKTEEEFVYDWAAVFMTMLVAFFAMAMAGMDMAFRHYPAWFH